MATQKLRCYLALSNAYHINFIRDAITIGIQQAGFQVVVPKRTRELLEVPAQDDILGAMTQADCIVADISDGDANIYYEVGLARAMGKAIFLLADEIIPPEVPADLSETFILTYSRNTEGANALAKRISKILADFRRFPRRRAALRSYSSQPFFVDWDKLSPSDAENLCKELLTQLGFKSIDWENTSAQVDMVAELPKKDPDGFEYRELWIISMGQRAPAELLFDIALKDPEYLWHWLFRYTDEHKARSYTQSQFSFTILLIVPRRGQVDEFALNDRWRRARRSGAGSNVRLRVWDQTYLTSLVHQFPHIGYKYFSDESRLRSETRKSYEDLYRENSQMVTRLTSVVVELEDEKKRRVSAERDAVWKDISFAAAHKIGNPIFAIETDLDPLLRRIHEQRTADAVEVVDNMRSAVEKAKGFVEQFKSLAKSQNIHVSPVQLCKILNDSFGLICNHELQFDIRCNEEIVLLGDSERLSECFDELIANSIHWFDKSEKIISVEVKLAPSAELPGVLDNSKKYALIHFKDNGRGIPLSNKSRIFDAFFTTYDHGTGLGLALVKRIIEGHGGVISETGIPEEGADFEIYLPLNG